MSDTVRHVLSLSGGKDSAALAIYMRDRVPDMEYVFHDTDKELPETYAYLSQLQTILGTPIQKTKAAMNFDQWLKVYGGMIPSSHRRWCTKMLKLKPFEDWIGDDPVINYIGIRADEDREGYVSSKANITPVYPFRDAGLIYADIVQILEDSGLGLPKYTEWGRTRSGCYFCFFQQRIEWVKLKETYPDLFEKAKAYEFANKLNGNPFYWNGTEPLSELEKPERIAEIKRRWAESQSRKPPQRKGTLLHVLSQLEDPDEPREGCLICEL
jgi:3'-phosphoadenosine 5'-phosphosulfate sulfotransferase (PAPS reductase)/FAD synthetase